jgi:hypothetical protein
VSTALSWTELVRSREDVGHLLAFRRSALSEQASRRLRYASGVVLGLTLASILAPAYLAGPTPRESSGSVLALLPSMCLGFLVLAIFSAVASGGGREVVPRDQAVAFPVSTTTDHLGAILMAPLNIAWMAQAWTLLGATSYALGPEKLWAYEIPILLWVVVATALAQVVGWFAEGVRRGRHGIVQFRVVVVVLVVTATALVLTSRLAPLLDRSPTRGMLDLVLAAPNGAWGTWVLGVVLLVFLAAAAVLGGTLPARWALQRPMREELRLESGRYRPGPPPRSDLAMMLRLDRAAVWRSVPLRRGLMVLALMPGGVALAGNLEWRMLTVLPGLVASGGALLFGVNTWCLDGRGALWRDSLPVSPRVAFWSRCLVLFEVLIASALVTVALAALRAGRPSFVEVVALVCSTFVVALQVVAAGMRWSIARPFAVDLRSARATPAPPVVMAGYSARLAMATTVTGLIYSGLAQVQDVRYTLSVTVILSAWSLMRLFRADWRWQDPAVRSRIVATVSGG